MFSKLFIDNLIRYMEEKNMTRKELSALTGISYSTLAGYFSEGIIPRGENIDLIAEALKVPISALFKDDKNDHLKMLEILSGMSEEDEQLIIALCKKIKKGDKIEIMID